MTVEEIFTKLHIHMSQGLTLHTEMIKAFAFLGLNGYEKCHQYHLYEEQKNYQHLLSYYSSHYFKILTLPPPLTLEIIPNTWYKYSASAVDTGTKRKAIKDLITKWIQWEKDTKKLYEEMYLELTNIREIAAALMIQNYIQDVTHELRQAQAELLKLETIEYNLELILDWQKSLKKKYKEKIHSLFK